ncbi:MAG: hypothetical protein AAGE52_00905 [Myxococcota bacterium]
MDLQALESVRDQVWLFAACVLGLVALLLTIRLKAPQWRLLGRGFRALRAPAKEGSAPGIVTTLAAVSNVGAAGVVGAATAVSLGGAGVLPYLWIFGIALAPLAYAETWLARTDAPGQSEVEKSGSLPRRLARMGERWRLPAFVLTALIVTTGFGFAAVHGEALADVTAALLPGSTLALVGGTAAVGAIIVLAGERARSLAGWLGAAGLLVVIAAAIWAIASDFGGSVAVLGQAFGSAFEGAPRFEEFTGAFAGEIAFAAVAYLLPPLGSTLGSAGGVHSLSGGRTRDQAALSVVAPLIYAVVATLLVMAFVGTGVFGQRFEDRRGIAETRIQSLSAASREQRVEEERSYDGLVRIMEGATRNPGLSVATARGMVSSPLFEENGEPADIALRVDHGRVFEVLKPGRFGALSPQDASEIRNIEVVGEMLPTGGSLVTHTLTEGASELAARFALAGLLALAAVAFAVWGFALSRSVPGEIKPPLQIALGILPAAGAALAVALSLPWIALVGSIAAGITAIVSALLLLLLSKEVAERHR